MSEQQGVLGVSLLTGEGGKSRLEVGGRAGGRAQIYHTNLHEKAGDLESEGRFEPMQTEMESVRTGGRGPCPAFARAQPACEGARSRGVRSCGGGKARLPAPPGLPPLAQAVVPIGLLYAGTLWLGNAAYLYLSVSFIQMLKVLLVIPSGTALWECWYCI